MNACLWHACALTNALARLSAGEFTTKADCFKAAQVVMPSRTKSSIANRLNRLGLLKKADKGVSGDTRGGQALDDEKQRWCSSGLAYSSQEDDILLSFAKRCAICQVYESTQVLRSEQ
jgi:hypothetical protein